MRRELTRTSISVTGLMAFTIQTHFTLLNVAQDTDAAQMISR